MHLPCTFLIATALAMSKSERGGISATTRGAAALWFCVWGRVGLGVGWEMVES
jgi:hypothetical protein